MEDPDENRDENMNGVNRHCAVNGHDMEVNGHDAVNGHCAENGHIDVEGHMEVNGHDTVNGHCAGNGQIDEDLHSEVNGQIDEEPQSEPVVREADSSDVYVVGFKFSGVDFVHRAVVKLLAAQNTYSPPTSCGSTKGVPNVCCCVDQLPSEKLTAKISSSSSSVSFSSLTSPKTTSVSSEAATESFESPMSIAPPFDLAMSTTESFDHESRTSSAQPLELPMSSKAESFVTPMSTSHTRISSKSWQSTTSSSESAKLSSPPPARAIKVVYVVRNPKDVAVVMYKNSGFDNTMSFSDYLTRYFCAKSEDWYEHTSRWMELLSTLHHTRIHIIYFNSLIQDLDGEVVKLCRFLGVSLSPDTVTSLCTQMSREADQPQTKRQRTNYVIQDHQHTFYEVDIWKGYFTVGLNQEFNSTFKHLLSFYINLLDTEQLLT